MRKTIKALGATGLMLDGDDTQKPDNAFTDSLNVRFNGREVAPYYGNEAEPGYTNNWSYTPPATETDPEPVAVISAWDSVQALKVIQCMPDGFSNGSRVLYTLTRSTTGGFGVIQSYILQGVSAMIADETVMTWPAISEWTLYKTAINNCPIFGAMQTEPAGKQYNWTGFDKLPGWGQQTIGNDGTTSNIVTYQWTCKKLVAFDNRLIALNTTEETASATTEPYSARVRWSGFAQENALPINWDDTAGNRTPEDFAAAVIDGYAGWQDLSTTTQIVDAVECGGTLYVYTERETYALQPSGNDQKPFITSLIYSDLGVLDIDCACNAHGYNWLFTGSDVVRHDAVSWVSVADDVCRDWLADYTENAQPGMARMVNYQDLSEIWLMVYGTDQTADDYGKTIALCYNYVKKTWSKKSLPYIADACFADRAPDVAAQPWDTDTATWDDHTQTWDSQASRVSQGSLVGACMRGGIYYLNKGSKEARHNPINDSADAYPASSAGVSIQPIQRYIERRGLVLNGDDRRAMATEVFIQGKGTNTITMSMGSADHMDAGYAWESQTVDLLSTRRPTFRQEGGVHAYRMETNGEGEIPSGLTITYSDTGDK